MLYEPVSDDLEDGFDRIYNGEAHVHSVQSLIIEGLRLSVLIVEETQSNRIQQDHKQDEVIEPPRT